MNTKVCTKCGEEKDLSEFYTTLKRRPGKCRTCENKYNAIKAREKFIPKKIVKPLTRTCSKCNLEKLTDEFYSKSKLLTRFSKKATCKECRKAYVRKWESENPQTSIVRKNWRDVNKEKVSLMNRKTKKKHAGRVNANNRQREATKLQAIPRWADNEKIKQVYKEAKELSLLTGIEFHVDHMVPLRSKLVCGLHAETNLQILVAKENKKKQNLYWENMP